MTLAGCVIDSFCECAHRSDSFRIAGMIDPDCRLCDRVAFVETTLSSRFDSSGWNLDLEAAAIVTFSSRNQRFREFS